MIKLEDIESPPYQKDDFDDIPPFAKKVADVPMMPKTDELIALDEWKKPVQTYMA